MTGRDPINLFCLPYAGGSAHTYRRFRRYLDPCISIVPMDPPGRGYRIDEPLIPSYRGMADDLFERFHRDLASSERRAAFFGHSMGASLSFLLIERMKREGIQAPVHLFASGSPGPAVSPRFKNLYRLSDDDLLQNLRSVCVIMDDKSGSRGVLDMFLPIMRSDLQGASFFELETGSARLDIPVTVFLGLDDAVTNTGPDTWSSFSDRVYRHFFTGDHFFFINHVFEIAEVINRSLLKNP